MLVQIRNPLRETLDSQTLHSQTRDPQTLEPQTRCMLFQIRNPLREFLDTQTLDPQTLDAQTRHTASPDPKSVARASRPPDTRPPDERVVRQIRNPLREPLDPQTLDPQTLDPETREWFARSEIPCASLSTPRL